MPQNEHPQNPHPPRDMEIRHDGLNDPPNLPNPHTATADEKRQMILRQRVATFCGGSFSLPWPNGQLQSSVHSYAAIYIYRKVRD